MCLQLIASAINLISNLHNDARINCVELFQLCNLGAHLCWIIWQFNAVGDERLSTWLNVLIIYHLFLHSCPFDFVRVHDGFDNTSAAIGTYCGQQRNLVLYSSESNLFVHFSTLQRTANTQNRGFKGIFEFSESFVKLDFIREWPTIDYMHF